MPNWFMINKDLQEASELMGRASQYYDVEDGVKDEVLISELKKAEWYFDMLVRRVSDHEDDRLGNL